MPFRFWICDWHAYARQSKDWLLSLWDTRSKISTVLSLKKFLSSFSLYFPPLFSSSRKRPLVIQNSELPVLQLGLTQLCNHYSEWKIYPEQSTMLKHQTIQLLYVYIYPLYSFDFFYLSLIIRWNQNHAINLSFRLILPALPPRYYVYELARGNLSGGG